MRRSGSCVMNVSRRSALSLWLAPWSSCISSSSARAWQVSSITFGTMDGAALSFSQSAIFLATRARGNREE